MRGVREAQWEWGGGVAEETPQTLAKPMRSPCEALANNTLSLPDPHAIPTLLTSLGVAGSAGAGGG